MPDTLRLLASELSLAFTRDAVRPPTDTDTEQSAVFVLSVNQLGAKASSTRLRVKIRRVATPFCVRTI